MRLILFQVVNGLEADGAKGFPTWAFWLLFFVIVALLVFILVRDRRARTRITLFFSWIGTKIRTARIKSKINRKTSEKTGLITRLGQLAWDNRIEVLDIVPETGEMDNLNRDKIRLNDEILNIDKEIENCQTGLDQIKKDYDKQVSGIEAEKKPLDLQYKELHRQIDSLNQRIKETEKSNARLKRDIVHQTREMEKAEADGYLSKIEKEAKKKEHEKNIESLRRKESEFASTRDPLEVELQKANTRLDELKSKIDEKESRVNELGEVFRERHKKDEETIDNFRKNRKALTIKRIGIEKQMTVLFGKSGEKLNQNRSDRKELQETYSRIDLVDQQIRELEDRLEKTKTKDNRRA
jgi:chromosome segregation ATPase